MSYDEHGTLCPLISFIYFEGTRNSGPVPVVAVETSETEMSDIYQRLTFPSTYLADGEGIDRAFEFYKF